MRPQHLDRDCGPDSGRDLPALISSPIDCLLKLKKFRFIQQFIFSNFLNRSLLEANCLNLQLMDHFGVNLFMEPVCLLRFFPYKYFFSLPWITINPLCFRFFWVTFMGSSTARASLSILTFTCQGHFFSDFKRRSTPGNTSPF